MRRRRHRRSWQRLGKTALGVLIVVLALELVYRLVALPPDYREARVASLATERQAEPRPAGEPAPEPARGPTDLDVAAIEPAAGGLAVDPVEPGLRLNRRLDPAPRREVARLTGDHPSAPPPLVAEIGRVPAAVADPVDGGAASSVSLPIAPLRPPAPRDRAVAPVIAIVIDDMGYSPSSLARLARLPGPLTLAFLPYADATEAMLRTAGRHDFELMLHLPMEPLGDADPGPEALMVGLESAELRRRVRWAIGQVPGAVGVNNHMGSRFTVDASGLSIVMDELRRHGLYYVDSRTNAASLAESKARAAGLPASRRNVFLDHDPAPRAITRQLALLERIAERHGNAIAIGHPYPTTLAALEAWLPSLERRGFRLARASEVIAARLCSEGVGREDCAPGLHLAGSDAPILPQAAGEAAP